MEDRITYNFKEIEIPDFNPEFFGLWLPAIVDKQGATIESVNYIFCNDEYLREINMKHLAHDYYTDIITFNYNDNLSLNAEIYISYERVVENASEYSNGIVWDELCRVMAHGLLHCLGFNDKSDEEKEEMRSMENESLELRNSFT